MDYAYLSDEDIRLNKLTFNWNENIQPLLKSSEAKLQRDKDFWIYRLKERRGKLSVRISDVLARVKDFRLKDRIADAENYLGELEAIELEIEEFNNEVFLFLSIQKKKIVH
jgi:hypothetical protein